MDRSLPNGSGSDNSKQPTQVYVVPEENHRDRERVVSTDINDDDDDDQNFKDIVHTLTVSTRELQEGCERDVVIKRDVICEACDGRGGKTGCLIDCTECNGTGITINCHVGRPFLILGGACQNCYGIGKNYEPQNRCWICQGKGIKRVNKSLNVIINKGMESGCKIIFPEAGNEERAIVPAPPGNVIFILDEKPNI